MKKKVIIASALLLVFAVAAVVGVGAYKKSVYKREYSEFVVKYSSEYNVSEALVYAVIKTESDFNKDAVSRAGATGLMQLMPETYSWLSRLMGEDAPTGEITDPETNIKYGVYYLSYLFNKFGEKDTVLAAYNAGHGRVAGWLSDTRYSSDGKSLKDIPYTETKNYVNKVNSAYDEYLKLYYKGE